MEQNQKQEELFPEIAKASGQDLVSRRREKHKSVKTILEMRDLAKKIEIKQEMRREAERKKTINEILGKK